VPSSIPEPVRDPHLEDAHTAPLFVLARSPCALRKFRSWLSEAIHRGSQLTGGGVLRRVLLVLVLGAFVVAVVVAVAVVPALAQSEQGCRGLIKTAEH
jgi:hypothetical protein